MDLKKWVDYNRRLRNKVVRQTEQGNEYLLANFSGTAQQADIEARRPPIGDFFRAKMNVKAYDEATMQQRGSHAIDFSDSPAIWQALATEFDMPYWAFTKLRSGKLAEFNNTFIYQLKGCNIHCPWCYVDDVNKNCEQGNNSRFFSMQEIMDYFEQQRQSETIRNFRPSGGEPTLAVEQWLEALKELDERGLSRQVYVQGDTNLTTGHFIDDLEETRQIPKYILRKVAAFPNFGLLCSFKGTDTQSFLSAIGMSSKCAFLEDERGYTFEKLVEAGIDAYPFVYGANPDTLEEFLDKGAKRFGDGFYLKTWIVKLGPWGPVKERLERHNINPVQYQQKLDEDFERSKEVMENVIQKRFGVPYQHVPRPGIELRVQHASNE
jgi:uncharacterized Fe-S cluster-containing radical SAM superfamily protein